MKRRLTRSWLCLAVSVTVPFWSWGAEAPDKRQHWSVQPVKEEYAPGASIDSFVEAGLAAKGLKMAPEADRRTLMRRLSFDLLGLPPSPERVEQFVNDPNPRAFNALVDEMLASPHYGERWARHWLDIAHYADTHGYERDQIRPNAWRYRDYVIKALNADKPYDQFLREQIAGDVIAPQNPESVIATGFLAAGPWDFVGQAETPSPVLKQIARADDLDDMVTQVMTAACAMTVNCARCHDHKLDPITQREYFSLTAVFAGVKRGDREVETGSEQRLAAQKQQMETEMAGVRKSLAVLERKGLSLADMAGGGDGTGTGKRGLGINAATGKPQAEAGEFIAHAKTNVPAEVAGDLIDSVVIPDGRGGGDVPVSVGGGKVRGIPATSGEAWDAIRNGPVNAQKSTSAGGVDFNAEGHSLLGLHANAALTINLAAVRKALHCGALKFRADAGYGGRPEEESVADVRLFVDGELVFAAEKLGPKSGRQFVELVIPESAGLFTLMATDGGDGIGHDQVFFGDPVFLPATPAPLTVAEQQAGAALKSKLAALEQQMKALPAADQVYAVTSGPAPVVQIHYRGDPAQLREEVAPGSLSWAASLKPELADGQSPEGERRRALADWITSPANPLTRRVIVNRLWHHHFGTGIVDTPSDFGTGGGWPSHPELLDWLAHEFSARGGSLKAMHRLIVSSAAWRQKSGVTNEAAQRVDAGNRLLWRMNPRRLDAESLRDAVLSVSAKLNSEMYGPGFRDFEYQEEYAPVYRYIVPDKQELWRRSVYRFVVRTTAHQFLTTLDCPNPANLTPARNVTTTALQSLAMLNNGFMQQQADHFAARVKRETDTGNPDKLAARAFALAFGRQPGEEELRTASVLVKSRGLGQLCRMLYNANEFVYVD